jgi:hypothetical protein
MDDTPAHTVACKKEFSTEKCLDKSKPMDNRSSVSPHCNPKTDGKFQLFFLYNLKGTPAKKKNPDN